MFSVQVRLISSFKVQGNAPTKMEWHLNLHPRARLLSRFWLAGLFLGRVSSRLQVLLDQVYTLNFIEEARGFPVLLSLNLSPTQSVPKCTC